MKAYPYRVIDIGMKATSTFKVNGSRPKQYLVGEPIEGKVSYGLKRALFREAPRTIFLAIEKNKEEVLAKKL